MKRGLLFAAVTLWVVSATWSVTQAASPQTAAPAPAPGAVSAAADAQQDAIKRYCVTCHNDRLKTSGLSLEKLDVSHAAANPDIWENVARKLQARAMPPQNARHPDE